MADTNLAAGSSQKKRRRQTLPAAKAFRVESCSDETSSGESEDEKAGGKHCGIFSSIAYAIHRADEREAAADVRVVVYDRVNGAREKTEFVVKPHVRLHDRYP